MINANSTITRCVRIALITLCNEITTPVGQNIRLTPSLPSAPAMMPPTNLSEAIDQCVGFMDPRQAAALLAMKPDATALGEASMTQDFLTNLLQQKSNTPPPKRTPTHSRWAEAAPQSNRLRVALHNWGMGGLTHTLTGTLTIVNGFKP